MRGNGFITDREYAVAIEAPSPSLPDPPNPATPYFVDMLNDDLESVSPARLPRSLRTKIYTSPIRSQKAANEAVAIGMKQVDELVHNSKRFKKAPFVDRRSRSAPSTHTPRNQSPGRAATMAPATHPVLSERPPGSIFKPLSTPPP